MSVCYIKKNSGLIQHGLVLDDVTMQEKKKGADFPIPYMSKSIKITLP
jgi:hypothetical protein